MKISEKREKHYFFTGILFLFGGLALLLYLLATRGYENDFITVASKAISLFLIVGGVVQLVKTFKFMQEHEVRFDIKNDKAIVDGSSYDLKNKLLSIEYEQDDLKELYRVSLYLQGDKTSETIFENIIFNKNEMQEFLNLIKPYKKSDICLIDDTRIVEYFQGGFMFEKREILYSEIKKFETVFVKVNGNVSYLDVDIVFKDGSSFSKRIASGKYSDFARVVYARMLYANGGKSVPPIECPKHKRLKWGKAIFGLNIAAVVAAFIWYDTFAIFLPGLMFAVDAIYLSYNEPHEIVLCEKLQEVQNELNDKDLEEK